MSEAQKLTEEIKRARDEAALKIHLASKDLQQEWKDLEERWASFQEKAALDQTAKGVAAALKQLGAELKGGYARIRKAL